MAQKINEIGVVVVRENKSVVFTQRRLKNIFFNGEGSVSVEYEKISDSGTTAESEILSLEKFNSLIENYIWDLIDQNLGKEE